MLPEPSFIERDAAKILAECVAFYEARTGKTLSPDQSERVLVDLIVYREMLIRIGIQDAATQNLVQYARYPMLDFLGQVSGTGRIGAKLARATQRFEVASPVVSSLLIPEGTRVRSADGRATFTTDTDETIAVGATYVDVGVTAAVAGPAANGYVAGQISVIVDELGFAATTRNLGVTDGGAPSEGTEAYRTRLPDAVRALSVAGPEEAYTFHAASAHPDIIDVEVANPEPRTARLAILARSGVPGPEILNLATAATSAKKVRPITDIVDVVPATAVHFSLVAHLTLRTGAISASVLAAATAAADAYVAYLRGAFKRRWVDAQASAALLVNGVFDVTIEDVGSGVRGLTAGQFAFCDGVTVDVTGFEAGP